jgi:uncharacterized protein
MAAAVITGASTGIGREFAFLCAHEGYDLVLIARSQFQLEIVASEIRRTTGRTVVVIAKDLSDPEIPREVYDEIVCTRLPVEVLINNAGFGLLGHFWELDQAEQMRMVHLNIGALTHLCRLFLPGFIEQRRGRILNVASTAAFQPGPLMSVYYASKAYVVSFSEALHNEARDYGVSVTALCPGPTRTEFDKRAGTSGTRLFKSRNMMDAPTVAKIGMDAMKSGKSLAIAGRLNAIMAFLTRFAPIEFTAGMARRFQESK